MYLKKSYNKKTNRTYLAIVQGYYEKSTGKAKSKTIKSIGYLDVLINEYPDPITFFTEEAKQLDAERLADNVSLTIDVSTSRALPINESFSKNFGYTVFSKIYHSLGIHDFLKNRQRHSNEEYDANVIMQLLIYSRLLFPGSKKNAYDGRSRFFENIDYSLDDVYRSLSFFYKHKDSLQLWINDKIKGLYGRDANLVYYDVTNYYFETDKIDDFRKKGVCKEHRPNPIVQMGLFMDTNGLPITYDLFPGNTNDCLTYRPNLSRIKKEYGLGKVIVIADKGMNTGDNIYFTLSARNGYVFSMSVRGADKELKEYVMDEAGYEWFGTEYKRKSRLYPRTILVTSNSGKKLKKKVDEKQVIFYSEKYAKRARVERAATISKAEDLIKNPGKYSRATSYGAAGYVKNVEFDKKTGEIIKTGKTLTLDLEKLKDDEALDGYYAIVTSEYEESDDRVIEMYRGLWKIEESFRITKSDLEARPIYVSKEEHIHAHFLTCFIALVLARILEMKTEHKHSIGKLLEALDRAECIHLEQNYYHFSSYDDVLKTIGDSFSIDFSRKYMNLGEIKKILGSTKKGEKTQ